MEKRIKFFHFQSVIAVAKAIDPHLRTLATQRKKVALLKENYDAKFAKLKAEFEAKATKIREEYDFSQSQIDSLETGILQNIGFHVSDLVKKVIEPTGKTDKAGRPIKETRYLPTDIVTYDENTKEFVITVPDEGETALPPTTEDTAGSDFDKDAESFRESEANNSEEPAGNVGEVSKVADEPSDEQERKDEMPWD